MGNQNKRHTKRKPFSFCKVDTSSLTTPSPQSIGMPKVRSLSPNCLKLVALLFFALCSIFFQPRFLYSGDPDVIRIEAMHLLTTGELGIPSSNQNEIPYHLQPPVANPNQYFWLNTATQKYYSRWGVLTTLLYTVPLAIMKLNTGIPSIYLFNAFNLILSIGMLWGMLTYAMGLVQNKVVGAVATVAILMSSYLLYYTRAHSQEIIQIALCMYALLAIQQLNRRLAEPGSKICGAMGAFIGVFYALILSKAYFIVWFAVAIPLVFLRRPMDGRMRNALVVSIAALVGILAIQLGINLVKFGSILEFGLGDPSPTTHSDWFSVLHYIDSMPDYLWGSNGAVGRFLPTLFLSIWGSFILARRPERRRELVFIWLSLLLLACTAGGFKEHRGEWCFGPRLLIHGVALVALLGVPALEATLNLKKLWLRNILLTLSVGAMAFGLWEECIVGYFQPFTVNIISNNTEAPELLERSQSEVLSDFKSFCHNDSMTQFASLVAKEQEKQSPQVFSEVVNIIHEMCEPNFLLFFR